MFDYQFRMIIEAPEEYHQLIEDQVKQEEDEVWFDKLDENVCTFKHKVHNWLKQGEESLKRESKQSSFGKKSHSSRSSSKSRRSRSSNSSTKERAIAERIRIAQLKAEALRIQEQIAKAEARAQVFEMMDQQSTKSEADLMKRKNSTIQSRATERDGNPLNFKYFITLFREVVESKIEDSRGKLTCLIKYTTGEAKELIKQCIEQPANKRYENAVNLLYRRYG